MNKCLQELGLSASANPLTNKFSIQAFDFSPGYVQILSDLLVSECYFGYLDNNEVLQVRSLQSDPGSSIIFTENDIIDLGPIGSGPLPAETVVVSYSSLRLRDPDDDDGNDGERIDWEKDTSETNVSVTIQYDAIDSLINPEFVSLTKEFKGQERTVSYRSYRRIDGRDVVAKSSTVTTTIAAIALNSYFTQLATFNGRNRSSLHFSGGIDPLWPIATIELSAFSYNDKGDEILRVTSTFKTRGEISSSSGLDFDGAGQASGSGNSFPSLSPFSDVTNGFFDAETVATNLRLPGYYLEDFPNPGDVIYYPSTTFQEVSRTVVTSEIVGNYSKTVTTEYQKPYLTAQGQQVIALEMEQILAGTPGAAGFSALRRKIEEAPLDQVRQTVDVSLKGVNTSQERPSGAALTNAALADGGDPNNGWKTDGSAELVLALGSATAQRRIELSMPYAPDDIFSGPPGGPFTSVRSDVKQKAANYGRVQNRLILGNRNGVSLQTVPEKIPSAPYTGFVINAGGYSTLYRVNAVQWAFDSSGIAASTDALFWGVIGKT
jgi:hypothetical protein